LRHLGSAENTQAQAVAGVAHLTWKIVGTGDYNRDGTSDILWRNTVTGDNTIFDSAYSTRVQGMAGMGDSTWTIEHETATWLNADGTYGV
jgi:hypothetical protein